MHQLVLIVMIAAPLGFGAFGASMSGIVKGADGTIIQAGLIIAQRLSGPAAPRVRRCRPVAVLV